MANAAGIQPGRLDFIEGMRGVAALYVMLQHIVSMVDPSRKLLLPGAEPALAAALTRPLWFGHLAVAAFIVISGYCLQLALFNRGEGRLEDVRGFLWRRCRRILPPYYACLVLSLGVAVWVTTPQAGPGLDRLPWAQYVPVTPEATLAHFLLVHNLSPEWMYKINGVLWSIAVEFQLYFVFPFLVWAVWRSRVGMVVGAGLVAAGLVLLVPGGLKLYGWYLGLFALGAGLAHWALTCEPTGGRRRWVGTVGLLSGLGVTALCGWDGGVAALGGPGWAVLWRDIAVAVPVGCALVLGTWARDSAVARVFGWRPLVWVGVFSYSLYLIHHPILQLVQVARPGWVDGPLANLAWLGAVGVPVMVLGSWGFFWLFERPFLGRGGRVSSGSGRGGGMVDAAVSKTASP